MRRHKLVQEILEKADKDLDNITTMLYLLSKMNDKVLTKFHKDFLLKPTHDETKTT